MNIRKLTTAALLSAIGTATAHLFYIPVGVAKCFPVQHTINLLAATLLGPAYGVGMAFSISMLRNLIGTGSLLAFPGSMIGALLAGILYEKSKKTSLAALGELVGTGILGAMVAYPLAKYLLGRETAIFIFIGPFFISAIVGVVIGMILLKILSGLMPEISIKYK